MTTRDTSWGHTRHLNAGIGLALSFIPPVSRIPPGGQIGSLWDRNYGQRGFELSENLSLCRDSGSRCQTALTTSTKPFCAMRAGLFCEEGIVGMVVGRSWGWGWGRRAEIGWCSGCEGRSEIRLP